jgi:serine/threonine protein kinase
MNRKFVDSGAADTSTFRRFSYAEIERSTDSFSTIIGKGGFGTVYKAQFADGLVAAVKRMYRVSRQREKEFCKEMEFLGRLHHRHLVTLRGFCITKTERFSPRSRNPNIIMVPVCF